jgi:hypothetical protein
MKHQSDYLATDMIADLILPAIVLRKRIVAAISQGATLHLG